MARTINMQDMRYLNLFSKITHINTGFCFKYNNAIMFGVPRSLIPRSLGKDGENIKKMGQILRKRVRVVAMPQGTKDMKIFIQQIINPVTFKDLELKEDEVILTAGSQSKAALIGRNKRRLLEMQKIVRDFFGKEFRIV